MRSCLLLVVCCALLGCAAIDPYTQAPVAQRLQRGDELGDCAQRFLASDRLIDAAGTRDAQALRVPGFPHLRVDRVLAALAPGPETTAQRAWAWKEELAALDAAARRFELANTESDGAALADSLAACRYLLTRADQYALPELIEAARVPDDYSISMRTLGLYPLTRHAFAAGVRGWQRATLKEFAAQAVADPASHRRVRYAATEQMVALPTLMGSSLLGLPTFPPSTLKRLIVRHAPHFEIETASDDDRPGALVWQHDATGWLSIAVAPERPVLYVRTGHTYFGGRWLLQLIYTLWFPARPPAHAYDVLAGRLDGLLWRVTLADDGKPLVYDTIHPCGCYHLFIPTEWVRPRPQPETVDEGLFAPQTLRSPVANERVVLRLAAVTHYLQQVAVASARHEHALALALRDDDELRALPLPDGGTRSAFAADGLIVGSERLERFYFWPMGVVSAGQMRQWGRHATAFVGRRHFDDPLLIDRYFERLP
ncbi:MAG: hypothetical protein KBE22_15945 [Candidatus Accumulibacter sp.]|nr:hypothetical protein [Accumulibacter sp.]